MEPEESSKPTVLPPSRRLRLIQGLASINVYGIFFSIGLAAANISRLFPFGGMIYVAVVCSIIGYTLLKTEASTERSRSVDAARVIILGIAISAIAFWDALVNFLTQPIFLGFWIIPLWQCLIFGVCMLMILIGILSTMQPRN
jgi:hypothetical protein